MVKRKISWEKYLIAFFMTGLIFFSGLMLGLVIENKRVEYIQERDKEERLDFYSLQLQYQFVDLFSEERNCQALSRTFDENVRRLEKTRSKLEDYQLDSTLKREDFDLLKREYIMAQVRYWILAKQAKSICDFEYSTILYFFGPQKECSYCDEQAFILTYLKKKLGMGLLNFAFDATYMEEPLIKLLVDVYEIKKLPTLVIDGEVYEGFMGRDEILEKVCPSFGEINVSICEPFSNESINESEET